MRVQRLSRAEARDRTRTLLVQAARRVFLRHGYHAATLDAVAEEAGFTKGAVYSAFDSKADLFLAVLDERVASRVRAIESADPRAVSPGAHAEALARQFVAAIEHDPQWSAVVIEFWAHASRDPDLRERFATRHAVLRTAYARAFEAMTQRSGRSLVIDADRVATIGLALGNGFALEAMAGGRVDGYLLPQVAGVLMTALTDRTDPR
ncbi:MAG TPA: TetR/AcrR family transcriptional regulator [Jiangellaceae bacterium]|nr:TetR/AcrR family transcriptional regulator [Jiangellaceae bacterium]